MYSMIPPPPPSPPFQKKITGLHYHSWRSFEGLCTEWGGLESLGTLDSEDFALQDPMPLGFRLLG